MSINTTNVCIIGTRHFNDYRLLKKQCDRILQNYDLDFVKILSGGAKGADALAEKYAKERGIDFEEYPADWNKHGKAAGPIRNKEMLRHADLLIAFWDGQSKGTANAISIAEATIPVFTIRYKAPIKTT